MHGFSRGARGKGPGPGQPPEGDDEFHGGAQPEKPAQNLVAALGEDAICSGEEYDAYRPAERCRPGSFSCGARPSRFTALVLSSIF